MRLIESATELTTAATDAVLAVECLVIMVCLRRAAPAIGQWRAALWCWVFGLLALASFLGAVAHGLALPNAVRDALWIPLYLSLGIVIALSMVGAVHDWRGQSVAVPLVPWSIAVALVFFGVTEMLSGSFVVFVVYEAMAMLGALAIYVYLAAKRRLPGAGVIATGIVLNLLAAGLQASDVSVRLWFPFDNNGVFHLVQMVATAMIGFGLMFRAS